MVAITYRLAGSGRSGIGAVVGGQFGILITHRLRTIEHAVLFLGFLGEGTDSSGQTDFDLFFFEDIDHLHAQVIDHEHREIGFLIRCCERDDVICFLHGEISRNLNTNHAVRKFLGFRLRRNRLHGRHRDHN